MAGYFITGTDTGIGKTWASLALMRFFQAHGLTVVGMKPIAAGCFLEGGQWRNEDALLLQACSSLPVEYEKLNIYPLTLPASPHIAAQAQGITVQLSNIVEQMQVLQNLADVVIVEGAGGLEVPINPRQRIADLAAALGLPVILVVGLKLGCLNHALLTQDAMQRRGLRCIGWIANRLQPDFLCWQENLATLRSELNFPLLGIIPFAADGSPMNAQFDQEGENFLLRCEEILLNQQVSVKFSLSR